MNIEKLTALLGQCENLVRIITELPEKHQAAIRSNALENGLDLALHARNLVRDKNKLLNLTEEGFEALAAISTDHVDREAMLQIEFNPNIGDDWGMVIYPNQYGAFIHCSADSVLTDSAPQCMHSIKTWALRRSMCWIKLDADAVIVTDLPVYKTELQAD